MSSAPLKQIFHALNALALITLPVQKADAARARACGPEAYNVSSGTQCGPAAFSSGLGGPCGTTYVEKWSDWGHGCNEKLNSVIAEMSYHTLGIATAGIVPLVGWASGKVETRVHRRGWKVDVQNRYLCEFNLPNHCAHSDFGVATWHTCAHPDFGTALFRDCALMTEEQLDAFLATTNHWLPQASESYTKAIAMFEAHEKSQTSLGCLIGDYEAKRIPFATKMIEDLKKVYRDTFGTDYTGPESACGETSVVRIANAVKNGNPVRDNAIDIFDSSYAVLAGQRDQVDLLMTDVVAQNDAGMRQRLENLHKQIANVMDPSE